MTPYPTILVATDFSDDSLKALVEAKKLAGKNTKILLVHVVEDRVAPLVSPELWKRVMADHQETTENKLEELAKEHLDEISYEALAPTGVPEDIIPDLARQHDASVIVMSSRGHNLASKIFIGSTTDRVLRAARCPVLIVKT